MENYIDRIDHKATISRMKSILEKFAWYYHSNEVIDYITLSGIVNISEVGSGSSHGSKIITAICNQQKNENFVHWIQSGMDQILEWELLFYKYEKNMSVGDIALLLNKSKKAIIRDLNTTYLELAMP